MIKITIRKKEIEYYGKIEDISVYNEKQDLKGNWIVSIQGEEYPFKKREDAEKMADEIRDGIEREEAIDVYYP
jgi:hypothetical protein